MNHEIENLKSSQISPNFEVHKNSKVLSGLYTQMLLDDFCRSYSIEFSVDENRQCFYDISPVGDTLKSILSSQQPWEFENIMDDLLSHMTANLIQYGRFFTEIVLLTDCNNIIMGISFVPIHPIASIVGRKNTCDYCKVITNKPKKIAPGCPAKSVRRKSPKSDRRVRFSPRPCQSGSGSPGLTPQQGPL